ncbi:nuclear transport factor 2 family protein [Tomitella fengzijianii]|uniref:Nuclear transport factor 2 family protein n=1 Tax=Tomitella fengzijianii TaxID=2597660 RepID=A0A516X5S1_9ACTN|nr:nuclear transport factor 2 family protein [Tomitella fengzijianii]QDQ98396.1 nuclear transport factor 2 family protein [Tomitella fengzijianii]
MDVQRDECSDRREIHEVVLTYARGIDRLDFDLVRSVYHPDAVDHHTGFEGGVDEYLAWVEPLLRRRARDGGGTMHMLGNHLVELHGDIAISETYGTSVHWGEPADDRRMNFTSGVRFIDRMERRHGRWAIAERWAAREWTRSDAGRMMPKEAAGPSGGSGADDPLIRLQRSVRGEGVTA